MIERSAIVELRLVEPPKMEQLVTDREGAEDVGGSRGGRAAKPVQRAFAIAPPPRTKPKAEKRLFVIGVAR